MRWKFAASGLLVAVALVAGCSTDKPSDTSAASATAAEQTTCSAASAGFAMGKKATPELVEQARAKAGARNVRLLKPDDMVTLEYRSDRLNLNADDSGVITRINCG